MHASSWTSVLLILALAFASRAEVSVTSVKPDVERRCSLAFSPASMVVDVLADTTLLIGSQFGAVRPEGVRRSSSVAYTDSPTPGARVRLRRVSADLRASLQAVGVADSTPIAYLKAMPYGVSCGAVLWTDAQPWVQSGTRGLVQLVQLLDSSQWIEGNPVLLVRHPHAYPYPARRGMYGIGATRDSLVSADMLFEYDSLSTCCAAGLEKWLSAHPAEIERPPLRALLRHTLLSRTGWRMLADSLAVSGTYRITVTARDTTHTWLLRTQQGAGGLFDAADSARSTRDILTSPYVNGFILEGRGAEDIASLVKAPSSRDPREGPAAFTLTVVDTLNHTHASKRVDAQLRFALAAVPRAAWEFLEPFFVGNPAPWETSGRHEAILSMPLTRRDGRPAWSGRSTWSLGTLRIEIAADQISRVELAR